MHHAESPGLRERKKLRTRRSIAEAALRLFAERGYEETTIADIAEAADVSPRTFFSYFPSKEDVVFAEIDDRLAEVRAGLTPPVPGETPLAATRRVITDMMAALAGEHGMYGPVQVRLIMARPTLQARALQRMYDTRQEVEDLLRLLCPEIDEIDAVTVAGVAVGGLQAAIIHCREHGHGPEETRAALDRALAIVERGLGSVPALTTRSAKNPPL